MLKIMLVCGSGASSGFMAAGMRKAAKQKGLEIEIFARSDAEIPEYADKVDVILLGSHLKYMKEDLQRKLSSYNLLIDVIDPLDYGRMDGKAVLEKILKRMEGDPS